MALRRLGTRSGADCRPVFVQRLAISPVVGRFLHAMVLGGPLQLSVARPRSSPRANSKPEAREPDNGRCNAPRCAPSARRSAVAGSGRTTSDGAHAHALGHTRTSHG